MRLSGFMAVPDRPIFNAFELCMAFLYFHPHHPIMYPRKPLKEKPMTCCFGSGQAEYLTMYKSFFESYDDADLAHDFRDRRSTSSNVITINQAAAHWKISKPLKPTTATTSAKP
eukprot:2857525-Ditylum_brightwellii.AAC.1